MDITSIFMSLPNIDFPAKHAVELINFSQSEQFFHLAVAKELRLKALFKASNGKIPRKVYLSANLKDFDCRLEKHEVEILEKHFFNEPDPIKKQKKQSLLSNAIVIINNNDVGISEARAGYASFFNECTTTLFIAWDWDNHHWLDLSVFLAAHSDFYAPAHHENLYLLSRYNWHIIGPVYCSSVQWSRIFLEANRNIIFNINRSSMPLGMHIPYARFAFRMQIIKTLNQRYASVGFSSHAFHARTPEEKLREWATYKIHWIAPVLNDVPIRVFDALITGGIPIVPESMSGLPPITQIPRQHIAFYSAIDIVEPENVVAFAIGLFDKGGIHGIEARHSMAMNFFHGEFSIQKMINQSFDTMSDANFS
jgi:hypothetical protein